MITRNFLAVFIAFFSFESIALKASYVPAPFTALNQYEVFWLLHCATPEAPQDAPRENHKVPQLVADDAIDYRTFVEMLYDMLVHLRHDKQALIDSNSIHRKCSRSTFNSLKLMIR